MLEYCRIRPGFEASFTIKPYSARWRVCGEGLYAYLQCVWRLALCFDRKKNRKRTGSSKNIRRMTAFLHNNMTSNKCTKNVLVLYMYKYGPLRTWPWRVALITFGILKVGFMYIFSRLPQIFRKPTAAITGRNGRLFTWGIVRIFIPGQKKG